MELKLIVSDMTCNHCVNRITSQVKKISGVKDVVINLEKKEVLITGDFNVESVKTSISDAGYTVQGG